MKKNILYILALFLFCSQLGFSQTRRKTALENSYNTGYYDAMKEMSDDTVRQEDIRSDPGKLKKENGRLLERNKIAKQNSKDSLKNLTKEVLDLRNKINELNSANTSLKDSNALMRGQLVLRDTMIADRERIIAMSKGGATNRSMNRKIPGRKEPLSVEDMLQGERDTGITVEVIGLDTIIMEGYRGKYVRILLSDPVRRDTIRFGSTQYIFNDFEGGPHTVGMYNIYRAIERMIIEKKTSDYLILLRGSADGKVKEFSKPLDKRFFFDKIRVLTFDVDKKYYGFGEKNKSISNPYGNEQLPNLRAAFIRKLFLNKADYPNIDPARVFVLDGDLFSEPKKENLRTVSILLYLGK